jgi:hypothetical protein
MLFIAGLVLLVLMVGMIAIGRPSDRDRRIFPAANLVR